MSARRTFALLLGLMLTSLLAPAQDTSQKKTIRLLTVGNSFSENATKYLDRIVGHRPGAERIAAGLYYWGRKRPHAGMAVAGGAAR